MPRTRAISDEGILLMLADGMLPGEIAEEVGLSRYTIQSHLKRMRREVRAKNITHLVALAYHTGKLTPRRSNGKESTHC